MTGPNRVIVPFVACGDLSGFDSDSTYDIKKDTEYHALTPVQPPINPPYQQALELKHNANVSSDT